MIVFDTETTGLINNPAAPLSEQPEVIEIAAIKLDDTTLEEVGRYQTLIKPRRLPLPAKIIEITRITDEMLADQRSFARILPTLTQFFLGESTCVAHNCSYDIGMFTLEMRRLDHMAKFPWPFRHVCTVETNMDIMGRRMKLGELHKHATGGEEIEGTHRAMNDVEALVRVVKWMRAEGKL